MSRSKRLRVLYVHHALYVPYLLASGLRQLGHKAANLYFDFGGSSADLTWGCDYNLPGHPLALHRHLPFLLSSLFKFDVFHFWAKPYLVPACFLMFSRHFPLDLALLKRAGKKIVFQSDGCYPMIRPSVWKTDIDPEICFVCQTTQGDTYGFCSNTNTIRLNKAMNKYADLRLGMGLPYDFEATAEYIFPPVDLGCWHPNLEIPQEFVYRRRKAESVVVYHGVGSHVIGQRGNIKGTQWVRQAVHDLQSSGYNVELMHVEGVPNNVVRYYQSQADIVVDQLLIGGGGQNARECLALGKPVLTRIHPPQNSAFEKAAHPFAPPPYVATDRTNVKENIARLVTDQKLREDLGQRSAAFARDVLDPVKAAARYVEHYERLF